MDPQPGNVAEAIEDYASKYNFDLIAMVSQTLDTDVPRVGSVCRKVVRGAQCPVWTIKTDDYDEEDMD
jgi:nucleotide-binding universal stress UspA family protein